MTYNYSSIINIKNDNNNLLISGYASVFNIIDNHKDIIFRGSFTDSIKNLENIKLLLEHDSSREIGTIISIIEDDYGLKINATITQNTLMGKEAIHLIKKQKLQGLSVGFVVHESSYDDSGTRTVSKAELLEISIVGCPVNDKANLLGYSYTNVISELCQSTEGAKTTLKNMRQQLCH